MIVERIVVGEPDVRDEYTNLRVEADYLLILRLRSGQVSNLSNSMTRTMKGLVLIQAPLFTDYRYGDRVRVEGARSVQTPTSTSDLTIASTSRVRMCIRSCRARD